mgnify:CR=1 FL=1
MAVSIETLPNMLPADLLERQRRQRRIALGVFAAIAVVGVVTTHHVPGWLDLHFQKFAQDRYKWTIIHRQSSPLFTRLLNPISDLLTWSVRHVASLLDWLRWPGVVALGGAVGWRTGGVRAGAYSGVALVLVGVISDWHLAMLTLAIMTVSVVIALVIGVPLGVLTARSARTERVVRVLLDTAQVMPIFVYFSPLLILFGLQMPPAVMATVIYALPPAVRLTNLGIRQVPVVVNEVGESFGATKWQQLLKVQLPMARRTILLGLNQVIMMAFAIVVLASLLGTGDLGQNVLAALQKQEVGKAFGAGLGIVLLAVALDRMSTGERVQSHSRLVRLVPVVPRRIAGTVAVSGVAIAVVLAHVAGWRQWPSSFTFDVSHGIDTAVKWVQDNVRKGVPIIGGTGSISDGLVQYVLDPLRSFLTWLPWLVVVALVSLVGYFSKGWRLATGAALCLVLLASMGSIPGGTGRVHLWNLAMDTLSQVIVALVISVLIALPLGLWAGRSDRVERLLRPLLDIAQVMPQFVYLIPVVFLFNVGRAAGVVACVVYAVPPCIRLTALGLREVPFAPREAAISFGATPRQELRQVQLPLARKAILLGINQTLLMVLATVIIAALVGAGALGLVAYEATAKPNLKLGSGAAGGVGIVLLAILLDRITQAWGREADSGRS